MTLRAGRSRSLSFPDSRGQEAAEWPGVPGTNNTTQAPTGPTGPPALGEGREGRLHGATTDGTPSWVRGLITTPCGVLDFN